MISTIYIVFTELLLSSELIELKIDNSYYFSMNLAEIFRVFYLECVIAPNLFGYYKTAPIQLNSLNSNLL